MLLSRVVVVVGGVDGYSEIACSTILRKIKIEQLYNYMDIVFYNFSLLELT